MTRPHSPYSIDYSRQDKMLSNSVINLKVMLLLAHSLIRSLATLYHTTPLWYYNIIISSIHGATLTIQFLLFLLFYNFIIL